MVRLLGCPVRDPRLFQIPFLTRTIGKSVIKFVTTDTIRGVQALMCALCVFHGESSVVQPEIVSCRAVFACVRARGLVA